MSDIGLSADLEVNADGVEKGTGKAITSLEALQNEIKNVQAQLASAADDASFNKLATKYNNLSKNVDILSKGNIKIAPIDLKPIDDTNAAITKVGTNTANLSNIMNRNLHGVADLFIAPGRAALIFANDLPQLIARFQELKAEQAALAAEGKEFKTSLELIGEAFNPIGAAISIASIALIHYFETSSNGEKEIKSLTEANEQLQESLAKNSNYTNAIANVSKLTEDIALAKEGHLQAKDVLKEYNDTIGKTTGQVSNLDQAEKALIKNKDAYLQMLAEKAVATEAYAQAAKKAVEAAVEQSKPVSESSFGSSFWAVLTGGLTDPDAYQRNLEDAKTQSVRAKKDAGQILQDIADSSEKKAAEIAAKFHFNLFGTDGDNESKKKAQTVQSILSDLTKAFADTDAQVEAHTTAMADVAKIKLGEIQKSINDLIKIGVSPTSAPIAGLQDILSHYTNEVLGSSEHVIDIKAPKIKLLTPEIDAKKTTGIQDYFKQQNEEAQKAWDENKKELDRLNNRINADLTSFVDNSLDALGTAIGSGDFSHLFDDLLSGLGDAVEKFGEEMLAYSIQANLLTDAILSFFATPAGIAAAAGLVAIGAAIKALAKKGTKGASSSSSGSYITPAAPSFYTPSQSANGSTAAASAFGGGSNVATNVGASVGATIGGSIQSIPIHGDFTLKGNDLVASVNRTNNNKNR